MGFIDKSHVESLLSREPHGTFMLRFSERCSGTVAVAYSEIDTTSGRLKLKHYLLKAKEFENLADFINNHSHFLWLLPASTEFNCRLVNCTLPRVKKSDFIAKYQPPPAEPEGKQVEGYVEQLSQDVPFLSDNI